MKDFEPTRERRSGRERRLLSLRRRTPAPDAVHEPDRRIVADRRSGDERRALAEDREQLSLGRRLRQPRTILSLAIPLVLLYLIFRVFLNIDVNELIDGVGRSNKLVILAAFVIFYAGFPLRGLRWALLLRGTGIRLRTRDATEIVFLSWLVNCLVPAKLGDIYRAYLLKINSTVSLSRTVGTVFIERILDLFAIAALGLAAGFWSFRNGLPTEIQWVAAIGVAVMLLLALGLLTLRNFGRRIIVRLPLPHRALELYDRFEEGVFGAIGLRALPRLIVITGLIWATESLRLYLVVQALAFPGVSLGLSGAVFVALIGSLLTAVPLAPAGLGVVELGVVGVLVAAYHVSLAQATTIALVDRVISVLSIIVLGSIAYWISPKRRGAGLSSDPGEAAAGAADPA
ncbi:MAG TPA: lysylphosphatidylglycerol synthase transmembrane domain-containing protein [Candidatus Limnocylindrales bacterium]|nr:lysylphosphatidylglycerol synthase transmembrane domain-containing protein [Candidatus Limnocylindrales bacterium]